MKITRTTWIAIGAIVVVFIIGAVVSKFFVPQGNPYVTPSASPAPTPTQHSIFRVKKALEAHFKETGTDAATMEDLAASNSIPEKGFNTKVHDSFTWTGSVKDGEFKGVITAHPMEGTKANEVSESFGVRKSKSAEEATTEE